MRVCTGFLWLVVAAERLSASEEGLCSIVGITLKINFRII
jgi:hypothetical protein